MACLSSDLLRMKHVACLSYAPDQVRLPRAIEAIAIPLAGVFYATGGQVTNRACRNSLAAFPSQATMMAVDEALHKGMNR